MDKSDHGFYRTALVCALLAAIVAGTKVVWVADHKFAVAENSELQRR